MLAAELVQLKVDVIFAGNLAAAVLMTLPLAVLFMFVQRHLVVGFGAGAVKG